MDEQMNPAGAAMSAAGEADAARFPLLSEHGRAMLRFLREHPSAPIFRDASGNRLTAEDLASVRAFDREVATSPPVGPGLPAWVPDFVRDCLRRVPHYRGYGLVDAPPGSRFHELPTTSRADLARDVAAFVPDDLPIDRLIQFSTSGTTGHPFIIPSHPVVAASYLALHRRALRQIGIELSHGRGQVGVVLVGFQRRCFTYVSVTPLLDDSGLAKINLQPSEWRHPDDRTRYLDALAPEIITGDPVSLVELAGLPLSARPRALLSTSMALLPATRALLEGRFGCSIVDIYSLNEAGPVAFADGDGWHLLQPRMFVEILDDAGRPVAPGERGEVTLTGGFNPWLPLLRYRTGDRASMVVRGREVVLAGLEGRAPVRFRSSSGEWLNNIEVTHTLGRFALSQWTLHQHADGLLTLRASGGNEALLRPALAELFGKEARLRVDASAVFDGKERQYTSDLDPSAAP
jgi:phenylacetate-CoA ligase